MEYRPIADGDEPALQRFFARIPEADRTFLKEDVDDPVVEDGEIVGSVAVVPLPGWSSHVGEIRLVVDPEHRGRGVARELARHAVHDAVELGLAKLVVEVIADQTALVGMFQGLGFDAEALLADHVRDRSGQIRDLLVLANDVESQFAAMATAGISEEL